MSTAAPQPSTQQQQTESAPGVSAARWRRDVLRHSKLKPTERLVAVALADFMDATGGNCRPSHEGIATRTGLHRNAVGRALRRLEAAGWIDVEGPATPNQHARSTYRPKNPTNVAELRPVDDVVDDVEGACTAESHAKGACTPGVHKVERPAKSRTLPKVESGEIPATSQETERLRVGDNPSPFIHSSTTSKTFDGLSRQEPSSAVTSDDHDDREATLRALIAEVSERLRANQRHRNELREKPLPAELRRPRSEWSDLDWSTSRRWQADLEAQMRPLLAEHNRLMAESDRLRDALGRERADLDDVPF